MFYQSYFFGIIFFILTPLLSSGIAFADHIPHSPITPPPLCQHEDKQFNITKFNKNLTCSLCDQQGDDVWTHISEMWGTFRKFYGDECSSVR